MSLELEITPMLQTLLAAFARQAIDKAICTLAVAYHFDVEDAKELVHVGGIVKQSIPLAAMPWTGKIIEENCQAIQFNKRLGTQCTNPR